MLQPIKFLSGIAVLIFLITSCGNNSGENEKTTPKQDSLLSTDTLVEETPVPKETKPAEKPKTIKQSTSPEAKQPPMQKVIPPRLKISNPLSSWVDNATKKRILDFVKAVTTKGSASYVDFDKRIAVFDNDGTLWSEKPTYFQIEFVLYRIRQMAPNHPEWKRDKLIKAAMNHDLETLRKKYGANGLGRLLQITQSGMTPEAFEKTVVEWLDNARHPETGHLFKEMVYRPMIELIDYLEAENFQVYLVTGAELDFVRSMSEELFHIPRNHIIASFQKLDYSQENGKIVLTKSPEHSQVIDGPEKVVGIQQIIGMKPLLAAGNSDGDLAMLSWCASRRGKSLPILIHHTDSIREWAYDKNTRTGRASKILMDAIQNSWLVVDMAADWKYIYYNEKNEAGATVSSTDKEQENE